MLGIYTSLKSFSDKFVLNYATLGFPFISGFPFHEWNETHPFTMTAGKLYNWKVSLSKKWVLNYTTLGFPFIREFPSQEWNETRALTMTGGQVYDSEKFHFLKSEC